MSSESTPKNEYEKLAEVFVQARSGPQSSEFDEVAYGEFLGMLRVRVENYLRRTSLDAGRRDDVTQDVLISVHLARHTYDSEKPFGPWLISIIRRRLIDFYRSSKRFQAEDIADHAELAQQNEAVDEKILLSEILGTLDEKRKAAIIGTEIDGFSTAEMADRLGMQHSAFRVMLHRTIKNLKRAVEV